MRILAAGLHCPVRLRFAPAAPVPKERADAEKVVGTWKMTLTRARRRPTRTW